MSSLLSLKNISIQYANGEWGMQNVSLDINKGEFILIFGESGNGKTSLINTINGVIPNIIASEVSGNIFWEGTDITKEDVITRANYIGSVFQNPNSQIIFDNVRDEFVFPLENLSFSREKIDHQLATVLPKIGLDENQKTSFLSAGEKQKVTVGTTLGMKQQLLLFDEPLANLDKESAHQLLRLLKELVTRENITVIIVEHRIKEVIDYVDRVIEVRKNQTNMQSEIFEWMNPTEFKDYYVNKKAEWISLQKTKDLKLQSPNDVEGIPLLWEMQNASYINADKRGFLFSDREKRHILKDINWKIQSGEKWLLLGENGAGKTTLMDIIVGQKKISSGKLVKNKNHSSLTNIGIVLQNPDYQLFMPNVEEEFIIQSKSKDFMKWLIEHFEMEAYLKQHPQSLSEGQKRKLGFACVLAMQPEILLLDEPSVGLDDTSIQKMLQAISIYEKKWLKKPLTVITISHDDRVINLFGDKRFILEKEVI